MIGRLISFRLLRAVAAIASLALILWTLGIPSLQFASAANLTSVSDTLSNTDVNAASDHTIVFSTPTGVANNESITIDFSDGPFTGTSSITATDITVDAFTVAAAPCVAQQVAFSFSGNVLTLELCSGNGASYSANGTSTITIGGTNQLVNPGAGTYDVLITAGPSDTGGTKVVILDNVDVTASVDTNFTFAVGAVTSGGSVNGTTTNITSTLTTIPFGTLGADGVYTGAQTLTINTNASQGYVVTVTANQNLLSSTGADIDSFNSAGGGNGVYTDTPGSWVSPGNGNPTIGDDNTYGHWGVTSDDTATTRSAEFGSNEWASISTTTGTVVMSNNGPVNGVGVGVGTTTVGYQVEVSNLQEAGDDYTATLTYVATPTF